MSLIQSNGRHNFMYSHAVVAEAKEGCCRGRQAQWHRQKQGAAAWNNPYAFCPPLCLYCSLMEQFWAYREAWLGDTKEWGGHAGGTVTFPHPWARSKKGTALSSGTSLRKGRAFVKLVLQNLAIHLLFQSINQSASQPANESMNSIS